MPKKPLKILAINPGSKYLGIAFLEGPELKDWRIKAIKGKWSKEKTEKVKMILLSFLDRYEPNILAIKKLHPSRSSSNLNRLVARTKEWANKKGVKKVYEYSIKDLENFFSTEEKIRNKKELAEVIVSEYPFLFHELNKEKNNKNPYFIRMIEAVALASVCFHKLDKP